MIFFSSKHEEWETPTSLIDSLTAAFPFDLDVAASKPNVCENYYTKQDDGLKSVWGYLNWCNPPYGRKQVSWVEKALSVWYYEQKRTLMLLPAKTGTKLWQDTIFKHASNICFIRGRLKFGSDQYWIEYYNNLLANGTEKKQEQAVKNLGGKHVFNANSRLKAYKFFNTREKLHNWYISERINKNSAPFDSALVMFGDFTTNEQYHTLYDLGTMR